MFTEPRWRSGRSPSTPARCREHIPLPPTMQPYLHIFSHLLVLRPFKPTKSLLIRGFCASVKATRRLRESAKRRAGADAETALAEPPDAEIRRRRYDRLAVARLTPERNTLARSLSNLAPPPPRPTRAREARVRRAAGRLQHRSRRVRLEQPRRHRRRPRGRGARLGGSVRSRKRAPHRRREDERAGRRQGAHPPGRPLPAAAGSAPDARLAPAELHPRSGALARSPCRRVPHLARLLQRAQLTAGTRAARQLGLGCVPVRFQRRPRRDRARYEQQRQGSLVPERPGRQGRRARNQLPRRLLPGQLQRRGLRLDRPLRRHRQRIGSAQRDRNHPQR